MQVFQVIDRGNVVEIKGLLKRGEKCYTILVGHITDQRKETVVPDNLKRPNAINIETPVTTSSDTHQVVEIIKETSTQMHTPF